MSHFSEASETSEFEIQKLPQSGLARFAHHVENGVVVFSLAAMVVLSLLDIVFRKFKFQGISGSTAFVQHGSLFVGLLGAAIAAREDRLLSLATATMFRKGWPRSVTKVIGAALGGVIGALLCIAAVQFVDSERLTSKVVAYGIRAWVMELVLPIGFALITLRVLYHSVERWRWRWIAPVMAAGILALCMWAPSDPEKWVVPAFVVLAAATIMGAPIFVILGGSALILFWGEGSPISSIPLDHYSLVTHPSLPTIPLFTLAGYFLAEGGASKRLVRVFSGLFGHIRGGPAIITALVCAFFTTFTGASGVTILALGGVVMPILQAARYKDRAALGLLTGAGSLGMLFPPCLPLMLYAIIANLPIRNIFLGAIIPGFVLVVMTAILGIWMGPRATADDPRPKFDGKEALAALWQAKWELLIPVVAMVALFGGFSTPVEASAITAFYAFLTQTVIWRDLSFRKGVPRVMTECGLVIGGVLLILGVAQGFTNYLVFAQIPQAAAEWVKNSVHSPHMFLLLLNLFLLVVGGLMDIYPAIIVVVPLIVPIGAAFGIDPIHLGVIFLANLEMGFLMPPVGMNLLLSSYRFKRPMTEVYRAILPVLVVQFIAVLLITYIPPMTTLLPQWFGEKVQSVGP